jgi:hypothetical protein
METLTSASVPAPAGQDPLRCPKCDKRARRVQREGRSIPFRNIGALALPTLLPIPTCPRCHQEFLDDQARQELDRLLPDLYAAELRHRVRVAIDTLSPRYISQRQLEQMLGLSQGYLSRLRAGAGTPSAELVSNLALLARDPLLRLHELRQFWNTPDTLVVTVMEAGGRR